MDKHDKQYQEAVVNEIVQKLKDNGFALSSKRITGIFSVLITVIFSLIGIVYVNLVNTDKALSAEIDFVKDRQDAMLMRMQNIENNLYLICASTKNVKCVPPIKE